MTSQPYVLVSVCIVSIVCVSCWHYKGGFLPLQPWKPRVGGLDSGFAKRSFAQHGGHHFLAGWFCMEARRNNTLSFLLGAGCREPFFGGTTPSRIKAPPKKTKNNMCFSLLAFLQTPPATRLHVERTSQAREDLPEPEPEGEEERCLEARRRLRVTCHLYPSDWCRFCDRFFFGGRVPLLK